MPKKETGRPVPQNKQQHKATKKSAETMDAIEGDGLWGLHKAVTKDDKAK